MSITNEFLKSKSALLKLQDIDPAKISDSIKNLQGLSDSNILGQEEVNGLISSYKTQIKAMIDKELSLAQSKGDMWAASSETEVDSKLKNLTPIIAGLPVISTPTPIEAGIAETSFLAGVAQVTNDLTSLVNNLNSILI